MEPTTYSIGDIVVLNSGGPDMTITAISNGGHLLWCIWTDDNGEIRESSFRNVMVTAR